MKKVFLGGTCNGSKWRDELIKNLKIDYFNPVVDDWNDEAQEKELEARANCDFVLYVITPKMTGVYSIAEVVDDSNKRPEKTLFYIQGEDDFERFTEGQYKSLKQIYSLVKSNGVHVFQSLSDVWHFLNDSDEPCNPAPEKESGVNYERYKIINLKGSKDEPEQIGLSKMGIDNLQDEIQEIIDELDSMGGERPFGKENTKEILKAITHLKLSNKWLKEESNNS